MSNSVQIIPFTNLALAFIPVFVVAGILYKWTADGSNTLYAVFRMLVQLLLSVGQGTPANVLGPEVGGEGVDDETSHVVLLGDLGGLLRQQHLVV